MKEGLASGFVLTNREMLALRELPQHLVVLGGGVIGLEMATYYAMADVDTTVVEMQDHIGGPSDRDMVKILQKNCEAEGMHFLLNAKVTRSGRAPSSMSKAEKPAHSLLIRCFCPLAVNPTPQALALKMSVC